MARVFVWFAGLSAAVLVLAVVLGVIYSAISGDGAAVIIFVAAMGILAGARGWQLARRRAAALLAKGEQ